MSRSRDVTVPPASSANASSRPRHCRRLVGALALALGWTVLAALGVGFFSLSSSTWGWLWAGAAFLPGLVGAALVWRGRRRGTLVVAVVAALTVGLATWYTAPPTPDRLERVATQVRLPDGWHQYDLNSSGNTWCFKGCPTVTVTYTVDGSYDREALDRLVAAFTEAGWRVQSEDGDRVRLRRGRWQAGLGPTASPDRTPYDARLVVTG